MSRCSVHCPSDDGLVAVAGLVAVGALCYAASVVLGAILPALVLGLSALAVAGIWFVVHVLRRDGLWIKMPAYVPEVAEPREWKRRAIAAAPLAIEAPKVVLSAVEILQSEGDKMADNGASVKERATHFNSAR